MSAPISLASMLTSVQRRANIENQVGFITLPEQREYLNEALSELYDLLVAARGQEHFRKQQAITTLANVSAYPLASDFYELISVDIQLAPNQKLDARAYSESERNMFQNYPLWPGWLLGFPVYYRIQGSPQSNGAMTIEKVINFIPYPQNSLFPVFVNYYPIFTPFATDGSQDNSVFNGVNGWEAFAIWSTVVTCKHKLKEDASLAMAKVTAIRTRIKSLASQNDAGTAERIKDVSETDCAPWGFR
jgi:hypothetical protein